MQKDQTGLQNSYTCVNFQSKDDLHCESILKLYKDMCYRRSTQFKYGFVKFQLGKESMRVNVATLLLFSPLVSSILSEYPQEQEPVIWLPEVKIETFQKLI